MSLDFSAFEQRKKDHIRLALMQANQAEECNALDAIHLMHEALPDLDFDKLSLSSQRLGKAVEKPFVVASMTAGHEAAPKINAHLIAACATMDWAMGVGSQRRELSDKTAAKEWHALRKQFPYVPLYSNLGIAQLIHTPMADIARLTDALQAAALMIHCNPLQECIQPEGTPSFKGAWHALSQLVRQSTLPVVVKETGCGFSAATLQRLADIGVQAVDVSGLGGTHWGRIEGQRAPTNSLYSQAAQTFKNWGVTTPQSVCNGRAIMPKLEIWGSGGVRHGLDAAKLIALGATSISFAKPLLAAAIDTEAAVIRCMQQIEYELKIAMFCTGSACLEDLKEKACL